MIFINSFTDIAGYLKNKISCMDCNKLYDNLEKLNNEKSVFTYIYIMQRGMNLIWIMNRIYYCVPDILMKDYIDILEQLRDRLKNIFNKLSKGAEVDVDEIPDNLTNLQQQIRELGKNSKVGIEHIKQYQKELEGIILQAELQFTKLTPIYCELLMLILETYLDIFKSSLVVQKGGESH